MSVLPNGDVLIAGGDNGSGPVSSIERFSPTSGSFVYQTTLSVARMRHAASALKDGRILFTGGIGVAGGGSLTALTWTEIYDPTSNSIAAGPTLNVARSAHTSTTLVDGTVLIAGGSNGSGDLASLEVYDPVANTMTLSSAILATARSGHVALLLPNNGHVLIAGGTSSGATLSSTELYRSWTGSVVANPVMSVARQGASATALQTDGTAVVAGGSTLVATDLYGFATVKTDASDYAPGTPVNITGSGWVPGETVTLSFLESPYYDTHPPITTVADASGNIANSSFSPDSHDVGIRFYLTATGSTSQAYNTFTDAASPTTLTFNPPTGITGVYGQSISVSVTLTTTGSSSVNNKPIDFTLNGAPAGQGNTQGNPSGVATNSISLGTTAPGTYPAGIGASFTASGSLAGSTASDPLTVTQASTTTSITNATPLATASAVGQSYEVDFSVAIVSPGAGAPTGTVTVSDGTATCSASISAAKCNLTSTSSGIKTITASYSGDTNFSGSTSAGISHQVGKGSSSTTLASSATSAVTYGSSVTFTATVTGGGVFPGGTATFMDGTTTLATVALVTSGSSSRTATFTTSSLTASGHSITAVYSGDSNYLTSTSAVLVWTVNKASLTVTAKNASKTYGQTLTFAGTEFTSSGLVNNDTVASVTLTSAGTAATATVVAGPYAIIPSAPAGTGLDNYNISYVNGSLSVTAAPLTITAKNASKMYGQSLTLAGTEFTTAGLVNSDSVSSVTLTSAGAAATATVAGGPYAITPSAAVGTGLGNYNISYVNGSLSVTAASLTITAKNASKTYGQTLTFAGTEFTTAGLVNSDAVSSVT
jgi:Bacterial Ig-like domain (group 3)/MBG domain (YGX type)/Galactose oxidase, central domain/Kelch motif